MTALICCVSHSDHNDKYNLAIFNKLGQNSNKKLLLFPLILMTKYWQFEDTALNILMIVKNQEN